VFLFRINADPTRIPNKEKSNPPKIAGMTGIKNKKMSHPNKPKTIPK
jgi:hypothetical protein